MPREDLDIHFSGIDDLITEINNQVPSTTYQSIQFRADLAGLLVVAIAATYESCVKEILYEYANSHHIAFGRFAQKNYEKLNSKIRVDDLKRYCELFDPAIKVKFNAGLSRRKRLLLDRIGQNIEQSYERILSWRHDFAHARIRNTTIEEAEKTHRIGKRVLYVFGEAFNSPL